VAADRFTPARKAHPGLRLPDARALEALAARLGGAGVGVTWDDELPGVRRFFTADPFGNRLELLAREP
jgi:hypothetical protein